jgi:hypothetical protein
MTRLPLTSSAIAAAFSSISLLLHEFLKLRRHGARVIHFVHHEPDAPNLALKFRRLALHRF